jgi:hypothetical protein
MPKLIIKQNLPPPSIEEKWLNALQIILPLVLLLVAVSAAVSLYSSNSNKATPTITSSPIQVDKPAVAVEPTAPPPPVQEVVPAVAVPVEVSPPPVVVPPVAPAVVEKTPEKPDMDAAKPDANAGLPPGVKLPPGMCPLFGPGAAECKANAKH